MRFRSAIILAVMSWPFSVITRAFSALVAAVATVTVMVGTPNIIQAEDDRARTQRQHEHIDRELANAAGVANYSITELDQDPSSTVVFGTHVVVKLATSYSPDQLGQLLAKLFGEGCDVSLVRLEFGPTSSLEVVHAQRDAQQWAELVDSVDQLEYARMRLAQFGPDSIAQFQLEVSSQSQDVIATYEQLHSQPIPSWVALGQLELETMTGTWPRLSVHAERAVTAAEWQRFCDRVAELRETTESQPHFSLSMTATDSGSEAQFEESIVPAPPPQFTPDPGQPQP